MHERYRRQTDRRQTTDGLTMTYSERERELNSKYLPGIGLAEPSRVTHHQHFHGTTSSPRELSDWFCRI